MAGSIFSGTGSCLPIPCGNDEEIPSGDLINAPPDVPMEYVFHCIIRLQSQNSGVMGSS